VYGKLRKYFRIIVVVEGKPLFADPIDNARSFIESNRLEFEVLSDPDEELGRIFQVRRLGTPLSIVVDPDKRIRLIAASHSPAKIDSTVLSEALLAFSGNTESQAPALALTAWTHVAPMPDSPLVLADGTRTSMTALSFDRPVVVTFLTGGDPGRETKRVANISGFASSPTMRMLFVVGRHVREMHRLKGPAPTITVARGSDRLFRQWEVNRGPVTAIVYRGRAVIREVIPLDSDRPIVQAIAYTAFLSASPRFNRIRVNFGDDSTIAKGRRL
jgi:hypothetical protein